MTPLALALALAAPAAADSTETLRTAPPFELKALDGTRWSLEGLRGKHVVIHFAATWCPFCNAEAPHLDVLQARYRDRGVVALWIDVKEGKRKVKKWVKAKGVTFPVLLDVDGKVAAGYAPPEAQPDLARDEVMIASNLLIDPQGRIRFFSLLDELLSAP